MPVVATILERLSVLPESRGAAVWCVPWEAGADVYTLARRKPTGVASVLPRTCAGNAVQRSRRRPRRRHLTKPSALRAPPPPL